MANPHFELVASVAYKMDCKIREELSQSTIADERDYVSNLTSQIRNHWDHLGLPTLLYSKVLSKSSENVFGCDAIILIRRGNGAKVCLFEAKFPRLKQHDYRWDYHSQSGISHFSDQLRRQSKWSHMAAIWELFIVEYKPGYAPVRLKKLVDLQASTCVWHISALRYDQLYREQSRIWNTGDFKNLLIPKYRLSKPRGKNIYDMLIEVCKCREGGAIPVENNRVVMRSQDSEQTIEIPAVANLDAIIRFCEQYELSHFLYVQPNPLEEDILPNFVR